jgi:bacterioferritin
MKGNPEVINALSNCLLEKHSSLLRINRYETQCLLWGYVNIGNFFAKIVRDDINGLFKLTKRILFLGGNFDEVAGERPEFGDTVEEMLPEVKEYILRNIATLTDSIEICEKNKDYTSRYLLEKLLVEEDERLSEIESLMIQHLRL